MCHNKELFTTLNPLQKSTDVVVWGDGRAFQAIGKGKIIVEMNLPNGESKACTLHNVLYMPGLFYNLLSVSQASKKGKIVKFTDSTCHILSKSHKLIAKATKRGSLYKLNCSFDTERVHFVSGPITNEDIWHQRFGHLGLHNLQKIAREKLVKGFKFDILRISPSVNRALMVNSIVQSFPKVRKGQNYLLVLFTAICVGK